MAHLSNPTQKRRLGQASSTLSKPFKSPLRQPAQKNTSDTDEKNHDTFQIPKREKREELALSSINQQDTTEHDSNDNGINDSGNNEDEPTSNTNKRHKPLPLKDYSSISPLHLRPKLHLLKQDPELSNLQKKQRTLQSRLLALRTELDTALQALRIESSDRDAELEALILKWRSVSQDAAEELFTGARERVARMGGVSGWKRMQRERREQEQRQMFIEMEIAGGSGGDDDCREEGDVALQGGNGKDVDVDDEDKEFTMDMMLNTLNVDLKVIGFDKENQRWNKP